MITFSAIDGACGIEAGEAQFQVFPKTPSKGTWSLLSHPAEELVDRRFISWPGEYDFQGVSVRSIGQEQGKQVSHAVVAGGVRIAFVDAPILSWSDADIEKLGDIDVLVAAAEKPASVQALVEAVDPRVLLLFPVASGDLKGVLKACGQTSVTPVATFSVKPGSLPQDSRQVVVLER